MKDWLRGPRGGLLAFLTISGLVVGGLGWVTAAVLRLEQEQLAGRAQAEYDARLRLAMWRLESQVTPLLAREQNRPFDHYSTIFAPTLVFNNRGTCLKAGSVLELTPLLSADLPDWMLLHFQINDKGWESPQSPSDDLVKQLSDPHLRDLLRPRVGDRSGKVLPNLTAERCKLLDQLARSLPARNLLALARERSEPTTLRDTTLVVTHGTPSQANWSNPPASQQPQQQPSPRDQPASQPQQGATNESQLENSLLQRANPSGQTGNTAGLQGQGGQTYTQNPLNTDYQSRQLLRQDGPGDEQQHDWAPPGAAFPDQRPGGRQRSGLAGVVQESAGQEAGDPADQAPNGGRSARGSAPDREPCDPAWQADEEGDPTYPCRGAHPSTAADSQG